MIRSEYDREQSQVRIADDFDREVIFSSEQALLLFRRLCQLFSRCQGCDQTVYPECLQALTYLRDVAPFRFQTVWLCPGCHASMLATSVHQ